MDSGEVGSTAKLIREARARAGLTQRQLAARAGTSGATVAAYERGRKEPRLGTLVRLITAAGGRLRVHLDSPPAGFRPPTREERRDLSFHRAVLRRLLDEPAAVRSRGLSNVAKLRELHADGSATTYLDAWQQLLSGDIEPLAAALTALDEHHRAMRQTTPFAGVLSSDERWDLIRADRREARCAATSSST